MNDCLDTPLSRNVVMTTPYDDSCRMFLKRKPRKMVLRGGITWIRLVRYANESLNCIGCIR